MNNEERITPKLPLELRFHSKSGEIYFGSMKLGTCLCDKEGYFAIQNLSDLNQAQRIGFEDSQFKIRIQLSFGTLTFDEFKSIQKGSMVPMDKKWGDAFSICVADQTIGHCELVTIGDELGIRVSSIDYSLPKFNHSLAVDKPSVSYKVVLGEINLSYGEISGLIPGSILNLRQSFQKPYRLIFMNGIEFSGEVVESDSILYFRILEDLTINDTDEKDEDQKYLPSNTKLETESSPESELESKLPSSKDLDWKKQISEKPNKIIKKYLKFANKSPKKLANLIEQALAISNLDGVTDFSEGMYIERGVAILLAIANKKQSTEFLKYMSPENLQTVLNQMERLGVVSDLHRNEALLLFLKLKSGKLIYGGPDQSKSILQSAFGETKAKEILNDLASSSNPRPFHFIQSAKPEHLLKFLQQELPQTIALVLSHLDSQVVSYLLSNLPEPLESEVKKRFPNLGRVSSDVLREVERVLERKIATMAEI